jgi:cytochrome c oxidase subunit I+III
LRYDIPEILVTDSLDGRPSHRHELPGPSIWPAILALFAGIAFIAAIFNPWVIPISVAPCSIALIGWFWPRRGSIDAKREKAA